MEAHLCHLSSELGVASPCVGAACAFWEADGCLIERLGLHTLHQPDISAFLLDIRTQLETASVAGQRAASRGQFARRLGSDV